LIAVKDHGQEDQQQQHQYIQHQDQQ